MSTRPALACHERLEQLGVHALSDVELLTILLGPMAGMNSTRDAAQRLLDAVPLSQLAWASADELRQQRLGRGGGGAPPMRGARVLDPARVYELMRPLAHAEHEEFHTVLLDVRGRLIKTVKIAEGSLTQCPVSPRDALREPVRVGAHGVVFVHNHPSSGDPSPSADDADLTDRLRAAADLVGVLARDHVIVAASGYYSFVEAGRWRR